MKAELIEAECLTKGRKFFVFRRFRDGVCDVLHGERNGDSAAHVVEIKRFERKPRRWRILRDKLMGSEPENQFKVLWTGKVDQ